MYLCWRHMTNYSSFFQDSFLITVIVFTGYKITIAIMAFRHDILVLLNVISSTFKTFPQMGHLGRLLTSSIMFGIFFCGWPDSLTARTIKYFPQSTLLVSCLYWLPLVTVLFSYYLCCLQTLWGKGKLSEGSQRDRWLTWPIEDINRPSPSTHLLKFRKGSLNFSFDVHLLHMSEEVLSLSCHFILFGYAWVM